MGAIWFFISGLALMALLVWLLPNLPALRRRTVPRAARRSARRLHEVHGPARVRAATELLASLTTDGHGMAIAQVWADIELPLIAALPDCPPADKPRLVAVLNAAADVCPHRDTAKSIMAVRNSLG